MSEGKQPQDRPQGKKGGVAPGHALNSIAKGPLPYQVGWLIPMALFVNSLWPSALHRVGYDFSVVVVVLTAAVGLTHFFVVQIRDLLVQLVEATHKPR